MVRPLLSLALTLAALTAQGADDDRVVGAETGMDPEPELDTD